MKSLRMAMIGLGIGALVIGSTCHAKDAVEFERKYALNLHGSGPYYRLILPAEVYEASQSAYLSDVRIINSAGEFVPFSLESPVAQPAKQQVVTDQVPWFRVPVSKSDRDAVKNRSASKEEGHNAEDSTLPVPPDRKMNDVIVDLSEGRDVTALRVRLNVTRYQGRVRVDTSNTLDRWETVTESELLRSSSGDRELVQDRIHLRGITRRYVRLTWLDSEPEITSVEVERTVGPKSPATENSVEAMQWVRALHVRKGEKAGQYLFDTAAAYPIERLRIDLPQINTVNRMTVENRTDAASGWRYVGSGAVYRIEGKTNEKLSPPLQFAIETKPQWRLSFDMRDSSPDIEPSAIMLGWRPATLTFIARGTAPFTLGVGNQEIKAAAQSRDTLVVDEGVQIGLAEVGKLLSSSPRKSTPKSSDSTRRSVLWMGLCAAVFTLIFMAWRLYKAGATDRNEPS